MKLLKVKKTVLFSLSLFITGLICVPVVYGDTGAEVLEVIPAARSVGMGGAFSAMAGDHASVFHNPAGLASVRHIEFPCGWSNLPDDISDIFEENGLEYYGIIYGLQDIRIANIKDPGTIAVTWNRINTKYLPDRITGSVDTYDKYVAVSYAKNILKIGDTGYISTGLNVKFFEEAATGSAAKGEAVDLGLLWKCPGNHLYASLAARNIGKEFKRGTEHLELPGKIIIGVSGKILKERIAFDFDFNKPAYDSLYVSSGLEYRFMKPLALRAGYNKELNPDNGITAGIGLSLEKVDCFFFYLKEVNVDYACPKADVPDDRPVFSLNIKLGVD